MVSNHPHPYLPLGSRDEVVLSSSRNTGRPVFGEHEDIRITKTSSVLAADKLVLMTNDEENLEGTC